MSMVEAMARVGEIRALVESITPAAPAAATSATATATTTAPTAASTSFSRSLAAASAAPAAAAPAPATPTGLARDGVTPLPSGGDGRVPVQLEPLLTAAADRNGLDPALVAAVARAESGFRVDAGSPAGARGLMQLMPSTAAGLGVTDILDPAQNLGAGSRYLKQQIDRFGDLRLALAAYNAGPGAVSRFGGVPPYAETQTYVDRVLGFYEQYRSNAASTL